MIEENSAYVGMLAGCVSRIETDQLGSARAGERARTREGDRREPSERERGAKRPVRAPEGRAAWAFSVTVATVIPNRQLLA